MSTEDEIRQAVSHLVAKTGPTERERLRTALRCLSDDRIQILAGYEGLTLSQLQVPFQALPYGTRMLLEGAGALNLTEDGHGNLDVEPLPFALELIEACIALQAEREGTLRLPSMREELDRIWRERYEVSPVQNPRVPEGLASDVEVVGVVSFDGTIVDVDPTSGARWIKILTKEGYDLPQAPRVSSPKIPFEAVGTHLDCTFAIAVPKRRWLRQPTPLAEVFAKNKGLGLIEVCYDPFVDKPAITFADDEDNVNAVMTLTDAAIH